MRRAVPLAVVLVAFAVWADVASACTCADRDERDRIEDGEDAIVGRVTGERPLDPEGYRRAYTVRVERSVGVRVTGEIELRVRFEQCGSPWVGRRQGFFVRRRPSGWFTDGCGIVERGRDLERALTPYRRPTGSGRVALLAAGRFGDSRLMALDLRGRVIGYGAGRGEARTVSVCPGGRRAAELAVAGRRALVAVRDLHSLEVVRSAELPAVRADRHAPVSPPLHCADADGAAVHVAISDYIQRTRFDRVRVFRLDAAGIHRVATVEGSTAAVGARDAYVGRYGGDTGEGGGLFRVSLATGEATRLADARTPEPMSLSPDGTRLALHDRDRLRVIDVATGREDARGIRYGQALEWLDAERLLFRSRGTTLVLSAGLQRLRRHSFVRLLHQAHVGGRIFGTSRYRLRALNLDSGRKRGVAQLTDRGVMDLVGVPGRPSIAPGRRRPPSPASVSAAARAGSACSSRRPGRRA